MFKKIITGLVVLAAVCVGGTGIAQAHSFQAEKNITMAAGKDIRETVFAAGNTIDIGSNVYGDVFCAGQTITISGTIHGDVICAGQTITISGRVEGDVRLASQVITLSGDVTGNATVASQSFTLADKGSINGDLSVGASNAGLSGTVGRDVAVSSGEAVISNEVGRNVKAFATSLTLAPGANVGGSINLVSEQEVHKSPDAVVAGKITRTDPPQHENKASGISAATYVAVVAYLLLAMLLIALVLSLLIPRLLYSITNQAIPRPWKALLTGFIGHAAVPIILLIIAGTVIGIPLALMGGLAWLLVVLLSGPVVAFYIGRLLFGSNRHAVLMMLAGSGILIVLYLIPFINVLTMIAVAWLGTGTILLELWRRWPRPVYKPVRKKP